MSRTPLPLDYGRLRDLLDGGRGVTHPGEAEAEARSLGALLSASGFPLGGSILEVCCGTGRVLSNLCDAYTVQGVEPLDALRAVAQERLGGDSPVWSSLSDVPSPVDGVLCLADGLGRLAGRRSAIPGVLSALMSRVRPGGWMVLASGPAAEVLAPGRALMETYDGPGVKIVRSAVVRAVGRRRQLDFSWLVARDGVGVETFEERQERPLVQGLDALLSEAGCTEQAAHPGGLWLCRREEYGTVSEVEGR